MDLTKENILKYFEEINEQLSEQNKFGEIVIAGGAALALVYNARNATQDIDAIFSPKEAFRQIIKRIGNKYNLEDDWLNDGVKGFFTDKMTASVYKEYSNLTVRSIDAECLLAMKLTSARTDTNDAGDSIVLMKHLCIKELDELYDIMEKYALRNQLTAQAKFFAMEIFERYYKEREKCIFCKGKETLSGSKTKTTLMERLEEGKRKAAEYEKSDSTDKNANRDSIE